MGPKTAEAVSVPSTKRLPQGRRRVRFPSDSNFFALNLFRHEVGVCKFETQKGPLDGFLLILDKEKGIVLPVKLTVDLSRYP